MNKLRTLVIAAASVLSQVAWADSVPESPWRNLGWRIGVSATPSYVPGTNSYLKGYNSEERRIDASLSACLRAGFTLNPESREGRLYEGCRQGIGVEAHTFFAGSLLGTPVSAFIYQGAPICSFSSRLSVGYEWKFGAAFGWKHYYDKEESDANVAISTPVTARMSVALLMRYMVSDDIELSAGIEGTHFSNGNTSLPNAGINSIGLALGFSYLVGGERPSGATRTAYADEDSDEKGWVYDITAYGGWRKRGLVIGHEGQVLPGRFCIAGIQAAPIYRFNRWFAAGPALDLMFDESANLKPYWVEDTYGDDVKFYRPPFGKQVSAGVSGHVQLTMPIFTIDAGIGYDFIKPGDERRFYQSLTLKTFVTKHLYLNVGYRLGEFKDPQNIMLGVGVRL